MGDLLTMLGLGFGAGCLIALLGLGHFRRRGGGRPALGLMKVICAPLVHLYWGARYRDFDRMPAEVPAEGLIVVSNHTSGLDPVLIEYATNLDIRWLMMKAMMVPGVRAFARWKRLFQIEFGPGDRAVIRQAMKAVKAGEVIGIFPEGGIERPARRIRPFMKGVGLMVAKTGARVALVQIDGVPEHENAFTGILLPCRARVRLIDVIDYGEERDAGMICEDLRQRMQAATGWPLEDEPIVHNS